MLFTAAFVFIYYTTWALFLVRRTSPSASLMRFSFLCWDEAVRELSGSSERRTGCNNGVGSRRGTGMASSPLCSSLRSGLVYPASRGRARGKISLRHLVIILQGSSIRKAERCTITTTPPSSFLNLRIPQTASFLSAAGTKTYSHAAHPSSPTHISQKKEILHTVHLTPSKPYPSHSSTPISNRQRANPIHSHSYPQPHP